MFHVYKVDIFYEYAYLKVLKLLLHLFRDECYGSLGNRAGSFQNDSFETNDLLIQFNERFGTVTPFGNTCSVHWRHYLIRSVTDARLLYVSGGTLYCCIVATRVP